jgi:HEAT repeat protein
MDPDESFSTSIDRLGMHLKVQLLSGKILTSLYVEPAWDVCAVKRAVDRQLHPGQCTLQLLAGHEMLQDSSTLEDLGIQDGFTLFAVLGLDPAVRELWDGLESEDVEERTAALDKLADKDTTMLQRMTADLRMLLGHSSPSIRQSIAYFFAEVGSFAEAIVPDLQVLLKDDSDAVRCAAAEALGSIGEQALPALPLVRALLESPGADRVASSENRLKWAIRRLESLSLEVEIINDLFL